MADGSRNSKSCGLVAPEVMQELKRRAVDDPATARLVELVERIGTEHAERTAEWAGRPINNEQDMVEFYRVINPEVGDDFARLFWSYLQERGIRIR